MGNSSRPAHVTSTFTSDALGAVNPQSSNVPPSEAAQCRGLLKEAIFHSTPTMEDYLIKRKRSSPTGLRSLRLLYSSLACFQSQSHASTGLASDLAKAWYRLGLLLRRLAKLTRASLLALEHAATLNPPNAGPSHSEITLLRMHQLRTAKDDAEEAELTRKIKLSHASAVRLNAPLATHNIKTEYNDLTLEEALALIQERHQQHQATELEADLGTAIRAVRDVQMLRGEANDAASLDQQLRSLVLDSDLPPPMYEFPTGTHPAS